MDTAILNSPVPLANREGEKPFISYENRVVFNGVKPENHQCFYFPQNGTTFQLYTGNLFKGKRVFEFCVTNGYPYDLIVMTCLLIAKWHMKGDILINSNSVSKDSALQVQKTWEEAFKFYGKLFGTNRLSALKAYITLSEDKDFNFLKKGVGNESL